jgi:hypothetical protein
MDGLGGDSEGVALGGGSEGGDGHATGPSASGVMTVVDPTVTSTEGFNRRGPGNAGEGIMDYGVRSTL